MSDIISWPQALTLVGGVLALIGAFWSAQKDVQTEKELNRKNEIIIQKTEEISELNNKIVNVLTGGDSYPYVILGSFDGKIGSPTLSLIGENAIPNISGVFFDVRELRKDQRTGNHVPGSGGIRFKKDILSPAYGMSLAGDKVKYDVTKGGRYLIHFYTPYNTFTQWLAVEPSSDNSFPMFASKIFRGSNNELIATHYPEDFPIPLEEIDFKEDISDEDWKEIRSRE